MADLGVPPPGTAWTLTGAPQGAAGGRVLDLTNVTMRFGGVTALNDVTFHIDRGEILGLIGPNGAGKTTCFNVMTGVYRATEGSVTFLGNPLVGLARNKITKLGIGRTFQNIRLFPEMTALENVMVGADAHHKTGPFSAMLGLPLHRREERDIVEGLGSGADDFMVKPVRVGELTEDLTDAAG